MKEYPYNSTYSLRLRFLVKDVSSSDQYIYTKASITLSWPPAITQTNDTFTYEVGYIARPDDAQCSSSSSSDINALPDGYTLFGNTTNNSIVVTGLQPGTCYVFGVRVYTNTPGEWTVILQQTITTGTLLEFNIVHY